MKKNFDTSVLRKTATDIQNAVQPKSITPKMVGGSLLALVEAQGEVVEALAKLEREKVTVRVNAYDGRQRVSTDGAVVYVDVFAVTGVPAVSLPRQELTVDDNGEVSFEVYKGYKYAVFSKLAGMSASFQFTFDASQDSRTVELWHFPVGVYMVGYAAYENGESYSHRCIPYIIDYYDSDVSDTMHWDLQDGEYIEDYRLCFGILVASENTSFVIEEKTLSDSPLRWANPRNSACPVPTLPMIDDNDWDTAQGLARADYDGNLNTEKILSFYKAAPAADYCANIDSDEFRQAFLPSAGQLYLMYLNKAAINALAKVANFENRKYDLLDSGWCWSSTQHKEFSAWCVGGVNGNPFYRNKLDSYDVRTVSAFHFIYK